MSGSSPAAASSPAAPATAAATRVRRLTGLRRNSTAISVMLLAEYALGMVINLYVQVPAAGARGGAAMLAHLPVAVTVHAVFGFLLLVAGVTVLVRAVRARTRPLIALAAAGLLAIIGAGAGGAVFAGNGQAGASLAMALLTGTALLCYLTVISVTSRANHGT